ncbi:helix-turn-helix domain-containing protein [Nocardia sp. NPDC005978]|uniref:helix-turn-helix domain-containing protein n=1 Tax=Nocardia sp. NPDC005978 TaxID=3156725 RepID=UPI0033A0FF79
MTTTRLRREVRQRVAGDVASTARAAPKALSGSGIQARPPAAESETDLPNGYRERASEIAGAVVWTRDIAPGSSTPILPDGCMDLLVIADRLVVAGPDSRAQAPSAGPATRVTGIRFYPGTAPGLLGVPAREVRDVRVELAELWTRDKFRRARDLFGAAPTAEAGLESIARWCAGEADPANPILGRTVTELAAGASAADTAALFELTPRHLHRICLDAFGYGPKTLSRILRMQRALELARAGVPLAEAAFRAGYADQPHLSRDVRALTGMPLTRLLGR